MKGKLTSPRHDSSPARETASVAVKPKRDASLSREKTYAGSTEKVSSPRRDSSLKRESTTVEPKKKRAAPKRDSSVNREDTTAEPNKKSGEPKEDSPFNKDNAIAEPKQKRTTAKRDSSLNRENTTAEPKKKGATPRKDTSLDRENSTLEKTKKHATPRRDGSLNRENTTLEPKKKRSTSKRDSSLDREPTTFIPKAKGETPRRDTALVRESTNVANKGKLKTPRRDTSISRENTTSGPTGKRDGASREPSQTRQTGEREGRAVAKEKSTVGSRGKQTTPRDASVPRKAEERESRSRHREKSNLGPQVKGSSQKKDASLSRHDDTNPLSIQREQTFVGVKEKQNLPKRDTSLTREKTTVGAKEKKKKKKRDTSMQSQDEGDSEPPTPRKQKSKPSKKETAQPSGSKTKKKSNRADTTEYNVDESADDDGMETANEDDGQLSESDGDEVVNSHEQLGRRKQPKYSAVEVDIVASENKPLVSGSDNNEKNKQAELAQSHPQTSHDAKRKIEWKPTLVHGRRIVTQEYVNDEENPEANADNDHSDDNADYNEANKGDQHSGNDRTQLQEPRLVEGEETDAEGDSVDVAMSPQTRQKHTAADEEEMAADTEEEELQNLADTREQSADVGYGGDDTGRRDRERHSSSQLRGEGRDSGPVTNPPQADRASRNSVTRSKDPGSLRDATPALDLGVMQEETAGEGRLSVQGQGKPTTAPSRPQSKQISHRESADVTSEIDDATSVTDDAGRSTKLSVRSMNQSRQRPHTRQTSDEQEDRVLGSITPRTKQSEETRLLASRHSRRGRRPDSQGVGTSASVLKEEDELSQRHDARSVTNQSEGRLSERSTRSRQRIPQQAREFQNNSSSSRLETKDEDEALMPSGESHEPIDQSEGTPVTEAAHARQSSQATSEQGVAENPEEEEETEMDADETTPRSHDRLPYGMDQHVPEEEHDDYPGSQSVTPARTRFPRRHISRISEEDMLEARLLSRTGSKVDQHTEDGEEDDDDSVVPLSLRIQREPSYTSMMDERG